MKHPWITIICLALMSCEGATYVDQRFTNATQDTLWLGCRNDPALTGWEWQEVWMVPPGATHVHYAVDQWGKCHECSAYEVAPYGLDSLWAEGQTLSVDWLNDKLWTVDVEEGLTWIRFNQNLRIVPSHFD